MYHTRTSSRFDETFTTKPAPLRVCEIFVKGISAITLIAPANPDKNTCVSNPSR
jgi:hypothetical protein